MKKKYIPIMPITGALIGAFGLAPVGAMGALGLSGLLGNLVLGSIGLIGGAVFGQAVAKISAKIFAPIIKQNLAKNKVVVDGKIQKKRVLTGCIATILYISTSLGIVIVGGRKIVEKAKDLIEKDNAKRIESVEPIRKYIQNSKTIRFNQEKLRSK